MEKDNSADSWFCFKPMVGGRITSGARKHKRFNEVRLVIGDFELPLQFKKIEATNLVKRTIDTFIYFLYIFKTVNIRRRIHMFTEVRYITPFTVCMRHKER